MRSRHVAAAAARPNNDPTKQPKGEFKVVARFYPSNAVEQLDREFGVGRWRISGLALKLMTSDNVAGPGLFNAPGNAGRFRVSWMPLDGGWVQGEGYINQGADGHDPVATPANFSGLTFNQLQSILASSSPVEISTLEFVKNGILAPVTNVLASTNATFLAALAGGMPVSLLFEAADDHVAFNFTSHLYGDDRFSSDYSAAVFVSALPLRAPVAGFASNAGRPFLTVHFERQRGVTNLTCVVEAAPDLIDGPWTLLASGTNGAPMSGPGLLGEAGALEPGISDVLVRDLETSPSPGCRFVRIRCIR
jgi:hypothetical protein